MDVIEFDKNADFEWATRLNRIMLNSIGIWPRAHKNAYDKFLSNVRATFTFIVLVFIGAIPLIHSLVRTWGDLMSMIDNLQFTLPLITTIIKIVVIWWKKTDLSMVINMIAEDWIKIKTGKERCIMIKQAQNARILSIIGYCCMFVGAGTLAILPCFGKCFRIIENTFTLLLLGLLIYFAILFCLYGFLIVAILTEGKKMSMMRFIYLIAVVINLCGHMCLFCAVGEILVAKCEAMYHAAYEHEWYKLKPKKAKILLLIMIRTNKPLYITAGKMFPITMSTFCNLIKTSAGYISFLFAMQG